MYLQAGDRLDNFKGVQKHQYALSNRLVNLFFGDWLSWLTPFIAPSVSPTISNALKIVKLICGYHKIPWRLAYTILQHEGGIHKFRHADGVMQTIAEARKYQIP